MTAYLEIGPCSRPHVKHASRQVFEQLLPHPREPLVNLPHNRRQEESCGVTCERFAEDQSEHGGPEQPCQDERDPYPRCAQRYESHGRLERGRHMSPLRLNEQAAVYPELLVIVHAHLEASRASARASASASASVVGKVRRAVVLVGKRLVGWLISKSRYDEQRFRRGPKRAISSPPPFSPWARPPAHGNFRLYREPSANSFPSCKCCPKNVS